MLAFLGGLAMDLLQLEHFLAVVEERTFTRAAERVCRTQPAVSQSIKKLEDEVGAPLFARDVHEVSLTEAGRVLADYARRMVHLRDEAMRQVSELKAMKAGTVTIAAHESAAVYLLPGPMRTYLRNFPDIKIKIHRSRLTEIPRQVMDREVDLGFVKDEPAFHELQSHDVHTDEMVCIAAPGHPLAHRVDVLLARAHRGVERGLGEARVVEGHVIGVQRVRDPGLDVVEQGPDGLHVLAGDALFAQAPVQRHADHAAHEAHARRLVLGHG